MYTYEHKSNNVKQDRQCMSDVTLRHIHETIVAMEKE
jgi:hypothetical protein